MDRKMCWEQTECLLVADMSGSGSGRQTGVWGPVCTHVAWCVCVHLHIQKYGASHLQNLVGAIHENH